MRVFVDTAAFLAILNANDRFYAPAKRAWAEILSSDTAPMSSNYVIVETTALLQHRFGMQAVRLFERSMLPVVEIVWVDEAVHRLAMGALLAANRRDLSLVDCCSFELMRQSGVDSAFTFDAHFAEQGFSVIQDA